MEPSKLSKENCRFYENQNKPKTETVLWIIAIKEDLDSAGITQADINLYIIEKIFRQKGLDRKVSPREKRKKKRE